MPAFGYSVGDCIASVELLVRIIKALRDSGGSASEFQQLQTDLEFLGAILKQLKIFDVVPEHSRAIASALATAQSVATSNAISHANALQRVENGLSQLAVNAKDNTQQTQSNQKVLMSALELSRTEASAHAGSIAASSHRLEDAMSDLTLAFNNGFRIWETDQRQVYQNMTKDLTKREERISQHISQASNDQLRAWNCFTEEARKCGQSSQSSMTLLHEAVGSQSSLLDSRLSHMHASIDAHTSETIALCTSLRSGIATLERLSDDKRQQSRRFSGQNRDDFNVPSSLASRNQQLMRSSPHWTHSPANASFDCATPPIGILVAQLLESVIIALWVVPWTLLRKFLVLLQRFGKNIVLYRTPRLHISECIHFFDALGGTRILQYDICRDWDTFHFLLRKHYFGRPGSGRVQREEFLLLDLRTRKAFSKANRSRELSPGSQVAMSIKIDEWRFYGRRCPRPSCSGFLKKIRENFQFYTQCTVCCTILHSTDAPTPASPTLENEPQIQTAHHNIKGQVHGCPAISSMETEELKAFRRVHVGPEIPSMDIEEIEACGKGLEGTKHAPFLRKDKLNTHLERAHRKEAMPIKHQTLEDKYKLIKSLLSPALTTAAATRERQETSEVLIESKSDVDLASGFDIDPALGFDIDPPSVVPVFRFDTHFRAVGSTLNVALRKPEIRYGSRDAVFACSDCEYLQLSSLNPACVMCGHF
ncbi:uncharacterized protein BDZ99DRAFT_499763 [Mytilinidion resinicola]|uniref:Ubiquitin-like domain-containing protein n=1 Tax=Mytilinidion resinicola TaxID=574789 RepID=A0A6A6YIS5_9PEZI|nr:uncharacterized protein BDZ99DRAFT_499763 [Mytilinidion resinicola]KAF2808448.1 hypothetical protein BDZ99DRAFT_499763 [Mytilinidion resinicola]